MKKDIEWLKAWFDDNKSYQGGYVKFKINQIDDVKNLSQELPVIPEYVAVWIVRHRDIFDLYPALRRLEGDSLIWDKIYKWYRENTHEFVNAYLTGEYEVEEEPLYYALVKGHELIADEGDWTCKYWKLDTSGGYVSPSNRFSTHGRFLIEMSKAEWNKLGINDSNADFIEVGEADICNK